jgi:DNA repair protein RecN (Recombination protein N)
MRSWRDYFFRCKRPCPLSSILFFDNGIDGITAIAVGELLAAIGKERQVLTITHFTQGSVKAQDHMSLCKETLSDRTLTRIRRLSTKKELTEEHNRVIGKLGSRVSPDPFDPLILKY